MDDVEKQARKALQCLYLELPGSVADDVNKKILAWVDFERKGQADHRKMIVDALKEVPEQLLSDMQLSDQQRELADKLRKE